MKTAIGAILISLALAGCGQNEPGTMGGEPATPKTVATGAPAQAAKESAVSNPESSAIESEHEMSSLDDKANQKPAPPLPQASTSQTNQPATR